MMHQCSIGVYPNLGGCQTERLTSIERASRRGKDKI